VSSGALLCTDGTVTIATDGAPLCSGFWSLVAVPQPFAIDAQLISDASAAFGAGFGLVFTVWCMSWGFRAVLSLLR
jgi:hypothetical protein